MTCKRIDAVLAMSGAVLMAACSSATAPASGDGTSTIDAGREGTADNNTTVVSEIAPTTGVPSNRSAQRLLIKHHKSECHGLAPQLCILGRESEQEDWTYRYDDIQGFEYSWGYNYELLISVHEVPDPPADGSSLEYRLIRTVSKTPIAQQETFDFPSVWAPELIERTSGNTFRLGFERQLSCDPADCETLTSLLDQNFSIFLELRHPVDSNAPLEIAQIKCSDAEISFRETCLP